MQAYSSLGAQNGWKVLSANKTLNEVAKKYDKSLAQILLKWALQHDFCKYGEYYSQSSQLSDCV